MAIQESRHTQPDDSKDNASQEVQAEAASGQEQSQPGQGSGPGDKTNPGSDRQQTEAGASQSSEGIDEPENEADPSWQEDEENDTQEEEPQGEDHDQGGKDDLYEHHRLEVTPGQRPMRLDQFLANALRNVSRTRIKNATLANCVKVNDKAAKASYKIKPGDTISYLLPHPPAPEATPEDIPINVVYEDKDVILVNKEPGMVVHSGIGHWNGTLVHALLHHFNKDKLDMPAETWERPYLVHRIDKDTSGVLIIAKNEFANAFLSKQFFERTTDRHYVAIVWGDMKQDQGTITGHVGRSLKNRKKFYVYPDGSNGKHAVTHYKVLDRFGFATLVRCKLETGRTHQIRVHMKYIGHTLFSDRFYYGNSIHARLNTPKFDEFIYNCMNTLPRQALHAKTLGFEHPTSRERLFFDSELPEDFTKAIEKMRRYRDAYL